jgi:hypothetical protein
MSFVFCTTLGGLFSGTSSRIQQLHFGQYNVPSTLAETSSTPKLREIIILLEIVCNFTFYHHLY